MRRPSWRLIFGHLWMLVALGCNYEEVGSQPAPLAKPADGAEAGASRDEEERSAATEAELARLRRLLHEGIVVKAEVSTELEAEKHDPVTIGERTITLPPVPKHYKVYKYRVEGTVYVHREEVDIGRLPSPPTEVEIVCLPGDPEEMFLGGRVILCMAILSLDPDDAETAAHQDVALSRAMLAREGESSATLNSLAWSLATSPFPSLRDGQEAIALATKACESTEWGKATYLDTLAAACAEAGEFEEAVKWQQKAIELAPWDHAERFKTRLDLYQNGKPHREIATGSE